MIKLRLNPFSNDEEVIGCKVNGNLREEFEKVLKDKGFKEENFDHFHVVFNGEIIEKELQSKITIKEKDNILIAPHIKGGDFGQIFKQVAILTIVAVVSVVASPGVGATLGAQFAYAGIVVATSIGATLLLNALIPPPEPGGLDLGGAGDSVERSQMYSLTGQSNQAKPYQVVPRVYGTFRVYPNVVGQPYIEVEVDPSTGKLVQVLYSIYDFGLGPNFIDDIRIGDTRIENFSDLEFNLVDPNKPAVDEGNWDKDINDTFKIYKGDVEINSDSYVLDFNRTGTNSSSSPDEYQVVRNGPANPENYNSELIVLLVFPSGLYSVDNAANFRNNQVEVRLEFAEVGTENWYGYNDLAFVDDFSTTGRISTRSITLYPFSVNPTYYTQVGDVWKGFLYLISTGITSTSYTPYGFAKGADRIYTQSEVFVNEQIILEGKRLGRVTQVNPIAGGYEVIFDGTLDRNFKLYDASEEYETQSGTVPSVNIIGSNTGRCYVEEVGAGLAVITANERSQYFAQFKFKPTIPSEYKIRITRERTNPTATTQTIDGMVFSTLTTRFNTPTVLTNLRHTFLEIKIRATNQINGSVDTLNALVSGVIPVYDSNTQTWNLGKTSNPAWIYADLLTGVVNKRAVSKDRLDLTSLVEWANYADEIPTAPPNITQFILPRFTCNFILDFSVPLKKLLSDIGGAAQGSLNIVDGKYGVLIDRQRDVPVQVFTPRNYDNFSVVRNYGEEVQGVKIQYNEPIANYKLKETVVYNDGFNKNNITQELQELKSFGITNSEQAWRFGRYMLSQYALRQETISITVDFEYLVCTRGDYVQFTQDSMKVGGRPARVNSITGNRITIDDGIDTVIGVNYGYVTRGVSGIETSTLTPIDGSTFDLDGTLPSVGDLIVIGEVDKIVFDCIVKAINPISDLKATLTLVEKADAIYTSLETGEIPDYDDNVTDASNVEQLAPSEVTLLAVDRSYFEAGEGQFNYYADLSWSKNLEGGIADVYEVYVNVNGQGYNLWDITKDLNYTYQYNNNNIGIEHEFKVLAVSSSGLKKDLIEVGFVTDTPQRKTTPPANVSEININITTQVIQLDWVLLSETEGVRDYIIRYNPTLEGTWVTSIPIATVDKFTSSTSVQARKGTYLIKAIDFENNESAEAALAITSIPEIFDLNIIDTINDRPLGWPGVKDRVEVFGDTLILQQQTTGEFFSEGYYYYDDLLDLGDNFTTRLQSLIEAGSYNEADLIVNWPTLAEINTLATSTIADWNLETQVRVTDQINFISTWNPLSDVITMSEGDVDSWKPYTTFIMGDFTAKIYQFRLKFSSFLPAVSPIVYDGEIKADMPDRIERGDNIVSSISGTTITYDPSFKGPGTTPTILITQDNAQQGDYYVLSNRTLDGFTITFYDSVDVAVSRQFDYQVIGFGYKAASFI